MVASVNNEHLLPPNATQQEQALSETVGRLSDVPVLVRESWNPDSCPASLLPWLAWAFSVDEWDASWAEAEKRGVIKDSLLVHKKKGTIGAIDRALKPLGYLIDVQEWFEDSPPATPFTFKLVVGTGSKPVEPELYPRLMRVVNANKNLRSQMTGMTIKLDSVGDLYAGSATQMGIAPTVYPYQLTELERAGPLYVAAALQMIDTINVRPQT